MLKISKNQQLTDIVSEANPIKTKHNINGESVELKLWLFNSNPDKKFENILIEPKGNLNEASWIQLAQDNSGVAGAYLNGGTPLSMANISDSLVAKPFWYKITNELVAETQNKSSISLNIKGEEYAI